MTAETVAETVSTPRSKCVAEHMGGERCVGRCLCPKDCSEKPLPHGTEQRARAVVDALSELMAAHEMVWRHGAQIAGAEMVRDRAVKLLTEALANAGCLAD